MKSSCWCNKSNEHRLHPNRCFVATSSVTPFCHWKCCLDVVLNCQILYKIKTALFLSYRLSVLFFCTCLLSCLKCTCNCAHVLVLESMGRRVVPLMVAVMANYRPDQTITITSFWTCGHTFCPPYGSQCSPPLCAHTQSFSEAFPSIF